jgi:hypothetical protein
LYRVSNFARIPAEEKEDDDDDNGDTLWYGARWRPTRWRCAAAANLLLLFSTAAAAAVVLLLPPFFVTTQLKLYFIFLGSFQEDLIRETFKKICTI